MILGKKYSIESYDNPIKYFGLLFLNATNSYFEIGKLILMNGNQILNLQNSTYCGYCEKYSQGYSTYINNVGYRCGGNVASEIISNSDQTSSIFTDYQSTTTLNGNAAKFLLPFRNDNNIRITDDTTYTQYGARYQSLGRKITKFHFVISNDGIIWNSLFFYDGTPASYDYGCIIDNEKLAETGYSFSLADYMQIF